jgi:hypothetical protein
MRSFLATDWPIIAGIHLEYGWLADVARTLVERLSSIAYEPCPFQPDREVRQTHFLCLGLSECNGEPLTISRWAQVAGFFGVPLVTETPGIVSHQEPLIYENHGDTCLYLVPSTYVFCGMSYEAQVAALPSSYEVSSAVEAVQAQYLHYQMRGEFFGGILSGRCIDIISSGARLRIGNVALRDRPQLTGGKLNHAEAGVGLAVHRKILITNSEL